MCALFDSPQPPPTTTHLPPCPRLLPVTAGGQGEIEPSDVVEAVMFCFRLSKNAVPVGWRAGRVGRPCARARWVLLVLPCAYALHTA